MNIRKAAGGQLHITSYNTGIDARVATSAYEWGFQGQTTVTLWWKPAVEDLPCTANGLQYSATPP